MVIYPVHNIIDQVGTKDGITSSVFVRVDDFQSRLAFIGVLANQKLISDYHHLLTGAILSPASVDGVQARVFFS